MKKKVIPAPVDVPGKNISFKLTPNGIRLYGEVIKVFFDIGPHPKYPNSQNRQLYKRLSVALADGRIMKLKAEQEDLKRYQVIADNSED